MKIIFKYILFFAVLFVISCQDGGGNNKEIDLKTLIKEGNSFYMDGDLDSALVIYKQIISVDPENAITINNIGEVFEAKNQLDSAEYYFLKAVELDGDNVFTLNNLAECYEIEKTPRKLD